ncbi:MAG: hypothetical protein EOM24_11075 [Chloroflexia bacterium]|nr:hypothetical protein [Chloroflexia bacterium]
MVGKISVGVAEGNGVLVGVAVKVGLGVGVSVGVSVGVAVASMATVALAGGKAGDGSLPGVTLPQIRPTLAKA